MNLATETTTATVLNRAIFGSKPSLAAPASNAIALNATASNATASNATFLHNVRGATDQAATSTARQGVAVRMTEASPTSCTASSGHHDRPTETVRRKVIRANNRLRTVYGNREGVR